MSSFFTIPGAQKKRKRPTAPEAPKKRIATSKAPAKFAQKPAAKPNGPTKKRIERDESISGSDSDDDESIETTSSASESGDSSGSDGEGETAAERRLRLAERYLENVKQQVDEAGFDAEEIDRDLIAERLEEDLAETKGKVYRNLASELAFDKASHTFFRNNTESFTAVAVSAPYAYTATKDLYVHKWRIQDLPETQFPQTTKKKPKRPSAPPKKRPQLQTWVRGNINNVQDRSFQRHVDKILCVAVSPDGKFLVTGGEDRRLIVYDAESLKPLRVFTQHRDAVTGLVFRRGSNQLYSCSKDRTVKVWSLDEMAYIETLFGHQDEVLNIDALAQERCISVGSRDRTARLWKVAEETQLVFRGGAVDKKSRPNVDPRSLPNEGSMDCVAMIDDDLFVTGSQNGSISLWSVQKKKPVSILALAHGLEVPLALTEASAEEHPTPKVIPAPQPRWVTALRTIPYSDVILSGSWDGHVRVWRLSDDRRKIERVGSLCGPDEETHTGTPNGVTSNGDSNGSSWEIKGVINDIAVFERGDRGQDGLCVVAAVGKEHRLGRWKMGKGSKNGGVVFEVPRIQKKPATNGIHVELPDEGNEKDD